MFVHLLWPISHMSWTYCLAYKERSERLHTTNMVHVSLALLIDITAIYLLNLTHLPYVNLICLICRWEKKKGDAVSEDEVVAEIETDKTAIPVPAPKHGIIEEVLVPDGTTVKAGQELFKLRVTGKPAAGAPAQAAAPPPAAAAPSPAPKPAAPAPGKLSFMAGLCCVVLPIDGLINQPMNTSASLFLETTPVLMLLFKNCLTEIIVSSSPSFIYSTLF